MRRDAHAQESANPESSPGAYVQDKADKRRRWRQHGQFVAIATGCVLVGVGDWVVGGFRSLLTLLAVACMAGGIEYGIRRSRRL